MKKLTDYDVFFLGIDWPDYFPGFGLGGTDHHYQHYVTGIGDTAFEAFEDALEMIHQSHDAKICDDEIVDDYKPDAPYFDGLQTVDDYVKSNEVDLDACAESGMMPHYYVGIRYNL